MAKKQSHKEIVAEMEAKIDKLDMNLNMLKLYFRDYDILEHYIAWMKAKGNETELPKKLKLDE